MLILAVLDIIIVMIAFYAFVPWAGRHVVLYALHGLRDHLYDIGSTEEIRSTRLYRDVEFVLCAAINRVRARDLAVVSRLLVAVAAPSGEREGGARYADSMRVLGPKLDGVIALMAPMTVALGVFVLVERPQRLLVVGIIIPMVVFWVLARSAADGFVMGPLRRLARAADLSLDGSRPALLAEPALRL